MTFAVVGASTAGVNRNHGNDLCRVVAPYHGISRQAVVSERLRDSFRYAIEAPIIIGETLYISVVEYLFEKLSGYTALIHSPKSVS